MIWSATSPRPSPACPSSSRPRSRSHRRLDVHVDRMMRKRLNVWWPVAALITTLLALGVACGEGGGGGDGDDATPAPQASPSKDSTPSTPASSRIITVDHFLPKD